MKILEVNTVMQGGSIPAYIRSIIAEANNRGHEVAVAKGRRADMEGVQNINIGNKADVAIHLAASRLLDRHGLESRHDTKRFITTAEAYDPDIIHLHNIHGYYLHYPTLMEWLRGAGKPVFWTIHDFWPMTGHCAYFSSKDGDCHRWQQQCGNCPMLKLYPASIMDRSADNLRHKIAAFTSVPTLTLLPVSNWVDSCLAQSHLRDIPRQVVKIDVDTATYHPYTTPATRRILGVAAFWNPLKGSDFFRRLRTEIPADVEIRLLGKSLGNMGPGIDTPGVITDPDELAREYSQATLFVNPTYAETYSMVNREALACGTPVVTRSTGGTTEDILIPGSPVWAAYGDDELIRAVKNALETAPALRDDARNTAASLFAEKPQMKRLFNIFEASSTKKK